LQDHGDLGTVDEPGQFFWGLLPMQWGPIVTHDGATLLYFGGRDERTIVGLGGSAEHVSGRRPPSSVRCPRRCCRCYLMRSMTDSTTKPATRQRTSPADPPTTSRRAALASVHRANGRLRGPAQNVEFIASGLLSGPSPYPELDGRTA